MKNALLAGMIAGMLLIGMVGTANANLITNGDFESGDTGFFSEYVRTPFFDPGRYTFTTNPGDLHRSFASYYDHTTNNGSGNMMAVNGGVTPSIVWEQDVMLSANTDYEFSIFISSWTSVNIAQLEFSLDHGAMALASVIAPTNAGVWEEYNILFNSGSLSGLISIGFTDTNFNSYGNDFAIDDISLVATSVPEPSIFLLFGTCLAVFIGSRVRRKEETIIGNKSDPIY